MAEITALNIPLVIENIFRHLRSKDLVRYRLAGPKCVWNKEACKILHKTYLVVLNQTADLSRFNDTFKSSIPGISMLPSIFIIYMDKMQESSENQEMLEQEMERFARIAGEQVKELTIHETFHETFALAQSMIFNLFPNLVKFDLRIRFKETIPVEQQDAVLLALSKKQEFPAIKSLVNLKFIKLTIFRSLYGSQLFKGWREFVSFTATLLASAPELQYFQLSIESTSSFTQHRCDQQSLRSLLQAFTLNLCSSQLKSITFRHIGLSGEFLLALSNHSIQFQLEKFILDNVDTNTVCLTDLEEFLNRNHATLEHLQLVFHGTSKMLCFPFGISMSKLRYLKLDSFEGTIDWKLLPKLNKISLSSCCLTEIVPSIVKSPSICCPKSFEIVRKRNAEDDKLLAMFIEVTPYLSSGLTSLALNHGYAVPFALIFGECRLLKSLRLFYCKGISDEALCGGINGTLQNVTWPEEEHPSEENASLVQYYRDKVEQAKKTNLELNRSLPYIGNLKDLQYFSATIDKKEDMHAEKGTGILTAASLLYGIIDCKKLKRFSLTSSHISPKRATRIIQHAGLDHLTHAGVNNINLFFLKDFLI